MRDTCAIRSNIAGYLFGFKEVLDRERSLGHADFLVKLTPVGGVVLALELELAVRPIVEVLIDLLLKHERDISPTQTQVTITQPSSTIMI